MAYATTTSATAKRTIRRTPLHSNAVHPPYSPSSCTYPSTMYSTYQASTITPVTTPTPAPAPALTPDRSPNTQTQSVQEKVRRPRLHNDIDAAHVPYTESLLFSPTPIQPAPLVKFTPYPRTPQEPQYSTRTPNPTKPKPKPQTGTTTVNKTGIEKPAEVKNFIDRIPSAPAPPAYQPPPPFTLHDTNPDMPMATDPMPRSDAKDLKTKVLKWLGAQNK